MHFLGSRSQFIFVEQPTEPVSSLDIDTVRRVRADWLRADQPVRNAEANASMRAVAVVVVHVSPQHALKVTARKDEEPVKALTPDRSHPALGERVCLRCSDRSLDDADPLGSKDAVEDGGKLGVAIVDEQAHGRRPVVQAEDEVASLLGDPGTIGCGRAVGEENASAGKLDEEDYVDRLNEMVSTVKKSQATTPAACARRNSVQVGPLRRGAGPRPSRRRMLRTVVTDATAPSFFNSP